MKTYYVLRFVEAKMGRDQKLPQDRDVKEYFIIVESEEDVEALMDGTRIREGFKYDDMVEIQGDLPGHWVIIGRPLRDAD
jgi:hypothetical protein